jgi:transposase InsO family protein
MLGFKSISWRFIVSTRITGIPLRREGIVVNRKRVRRLMRELGIRVIRKKRPFYGRKASILFPNRLNQEFTAEAPLRRLVTDITTFESGTTLPICRLAGFVQP